MAVRLVLVLSWSGGHRRVLPVPPALLLSWHGGHRLVLAVPSVPPALLPLRLCLLPVVSCVVLPCITPRSYLADEPYSLLRFVGQVKESHLHM